MLAACGGQKIVTKADGYMELTANREVSRVLIHTRCGLADAGIGDEIDLGACSFMIEDCMLDSISLNNRGTYS